MSHHLITFEQVGYTYPDGTQALTSVSFEVHHGDKVALIGTNGAGKSTLLQLLSGLLDAQSGSIHIGQTPVSPANLKHIRQRLGVIFQDPDDQLFMPTVFEDVAFGLRNIGVSESDIPGRVKAALDTVEAADLADKPPYRLSGGQKRAVAIAGVLAMEPSVLVLDEPSNALDPLARQRLIGLLQQFSHSQLIATHDLELVLAVCHRVIILHEGRVAANATPKTVFQDKELLKRCGLQ